MKTLAAIITSLFTFSAIAQTNVITSNMRAVAKTKEMCGTFNNYWYVGVTSYIGPGMQNSNKWYYQTTNIHVLSYTNSDALIQYVGNNGAMGCNLGTIIWTDSIPAQTYRFTIYWSNNITVPTNLPVPLTTVGFRTNAP